MGVLAVIRMTEDLPEMEWQEFANDVEQGIKYFLRTHTRRSTGRLAESIKALVYGRQIVVESDAPHARAMDRGTLRSRAIWGLISKVIPIKLHDGKVIFRKVTLKSVASGKWRQGPQRGLDFVRGGVELAKSRGSLRSRINVIVQR